MKTKKILFASLLFYIQLNLINAQGIIINHACTNINLIPDLEITNAKDNLHIAYAHTSHGSQIITGMNNLDNFMGGTGLFKWNDGPQQGSLDIDDYFVSGDLGNPDRIAWASRTREYLNNPNNFDVNVIIWSWCGQVSSASEDDINTYLILMNQLESDFPNVKFVYMTGHLDGSGLMGNLNLRNEQIRSYCKNNNKILFDFADIECYDPDGNYFGDKIPNDNCDYDSDANGSRDANWAVEWQNSHTENAAWYTCSSAHSQSLNANQKAYAAWWLWATLAGWNNATLVEKHFPLKSSFQLNNNYPNPFNPETNISFTLNEDVKVEIDLFDILGNKIRTLTNKEYSTGYHNLIWNGLNDFGKEVNAGVYIYQMKARNYIASKRMVLLK